LQPFSIEKTADYPTEKNATVETVSTVAKEFCSEL